MTRYFISYSHKDKKRVGYIVRELKNAGIETWWDQKDLPPGENWNDEIQHALDTCDSMLLFVSSTSMASSNVKDEWTYFLSEEKQILPILLEQTELPFQLSRKQWFDDFITRDFKTAVENLINILGVDESRREKDIPPTTDNDGCLQKSKIKIEISVVIFLIVLLAIVSPFLSCFGDGCNFMLLESTFIADNTTSTLDETRTATSPSGIETNVSSPTPTLTLISTNTVFTDDAPNITHINNQSNIIGDQVSLQIQVTNNSGSIFTYSQSTTSTLPPGVTLNSSTGFISGTVNTTGTYNVSINVRSANPPSTGNVSFMWTVSELQEGGSNNQDDNSGPLQTEEPVETAPDPDNRVSLGTQPFLSFTSDNPTFVAARVCSSNVEQYNMYFHIIQETPGGITRTYNYVLDTGANALTHIYSQDNGESGTVLYSGQHYEETYRDTIPQPHYFYTVIDYDRNGVPCHKIMKINGQLSRAGEYTLCVSFNDQPIAPYNTDSMQMCSTATKQ